MMLGSAWSRLRYVASRTLLAAALSWGGTAAAQPVLDLQLVASGFAGPVGVANARDGSNRLFIVEQGGTIRIYDGAQVLATPFLNITSKVLSGGERGLLGLAFDASYASNGLFYVYYTSQPAGEVTIARYHVTGAPNVADPNSEVILKTQAHADFANHNGGSLLFGPDGCLYAGIGDGGSGGDPFNNGQNLNTLLGKIIRISPADGTPCAAAPGNPFVGVAGARGEIWALGVRNPWRITFDRQTGDLLIADVGQGAREEVNVQPAGVAGRNYCWRRKEGTLIFDANVPCTAGTPTDPVLEYDHSGGKCSITGGYRYRGSRIPDIVGTYFYGDYCTGQIWRATESGGVWTSSQLFDTAFNISTFGEDEGGEIYVVHIGGSLYRLVDTRVATTTAVTGTPNPSVSGQSVTFTATVTPAGAGTPTGTVTFKDGATTLGTGTLSSGSAGFSTAALGVGGHTITAVYGGDVTFAASTSPGVAQSVNKGATATAVSATPNPSTLGQSVTFTATVTASAPAAGTASGTVTFKDGAATLGAGTLSNGAAGFSTAALSEGQHTISAVYGGDASFTGSTSAGVTLTVQPPPPLTRTFVSANGSDLNNCGRATPCRTFQTAHNRTVAGGAISVLDPAGYGPVTISKSIGIVNDGVGAAGILVPAGVAGITIDAAAGDRINIRGLVIEGAGVGGAGIVFHTGQELSIQNCVIRGLAGSGIAFTPAASSILTVASAFVAGNAADGIHVEPAGSGTVNAVLDGVRIYNNGGHGVFVTSASATLNVVARDSVSSQNALNGFAVAAGSLMVIGGAAAGNAIGLASSNGAPLRVGRSTVTGNGTGWSGAGVQSYGDNRIDGNAGGETAPPQLPRK
ncbi:MAG: hypothetical protein QOG83_246 [Alphaproteobacteria bacterium]|nr:hypothetical protein [Alphaproteobacteria bacterium]